MADSWADRAYLRGTQYKTDANLAARQSIYAYQRPRVDLAAWVVDLAGPAPSDTIADVGCGNGMYLAELAMRGLPCRVLGVDLSFGMLAAARQRLAAARVALAGGDATALPLRDGVVDLALAAHMLHHVPTRPTPSAKPAPVTRPGGRVVIVLNGASHLRQLRTAIRRGARRPRGGKRRARYPGRRRVPGEVLLRPGHQARFPGGAPRPGTGPDRGVRALAVRPGSPAPARRASPRP